MVQKMDAKPTVLKLGGSVITDKEKPLTPNLEAIGRLADEISNANVSPLILVHGGGSFGHPVALQYGIAEGFVHPSQVLGFAATHLAMTLLNSWVMEALISRNIPAVEVHPSSCLVTHDGRIEKMEIKPLKKMLKMGVVPVLYGDPVPDTKKGFAILSGDQLVSWLAINLGADRIIMGADVDGLFTADPKTDSSAKLISHVTLSELRNLEHKIEGSKTTDVTGGMLGKMQEILVTLDHGIKTFVVNATKPERVFKALKGETVTGTVIEKGETVD
jgi:isopentenyl phosphate kinase